MSVFTGPVQFNPFFQYCSTLFHIRKEYLFLIICHDIKGLNDFVKRKIWEHGEDKNNPKPSIPTQSYVIPLNNGDLGAALHRVKVDINATKN